MKKIVKFLIIYKDKNLSLIGERKREKERNKENNKMKLKLEMKSTMNKNESESKKLKKHPEVENVQKKTLIYLIIM